MAPGMAARGVVVVFGDDILPTELLLLPWDPNRHPISESKNLLTQLVESAGPLPVLAHYVPLSGKWSVP